MSVPKSISVNGERWAVDFDRLHGQCLYKDKIIQADGTEKHKRIFLEAVLHEIIHAFRPEMAEAAVDKIAKAQAALLWRLGYRCK